jgi:hypothetical protein
VPDPVLDGADHGCHAFCRRRHPHDGPAVLNREDAERADRAARPEPEAAPEPSPGAPSRAMAAAAVGGGDYIAAVAWSLVSIAHDVAAIRNDVRHIARAQARGGR